MNENNNRIARRILYVDASYNNETKESKICLYDVDENKLDTLVTSMPTSSSFAERYAVVYGCLYAKKLNISDKRVHILNDNFSATSHTKIKELCQVLNISVSWIPREINTIADKGTLNSCNIQIEDIHICDLFYELMIEKNINNNKITTKQEPEIATTKTNNNNEKNILIKAVKAAKIENKPYVSLGQVGKYLKNNYPSIKYTSLKKILEKYPKSFTIVNSNYVKIIVK